MTSDRDDLDERLGALVRELRAAADDPTRERVDAVRTACRHLADIATGDVSDVVDEIDGTLTTVTALRDVVEGRVGDGRMDLGELRNWVDRQDRVYATMADGLDELRATLPGADLDDLPDVARIPERVHEARFR